MKLYNLIPHLFLIIGLAGVLVVVGRRIPDLTALEVEEKPFIPPKIKAYWRDILLWLKERFNADKIQMFLLVRLEKFLRRFRIMTLKVDNGTFSWLKKIREKSITVSPAYWSVFRKEGQIEEVGEETKNAAPREAEDL